MKEKIIFLILVILTVSCKDNRQTCHLSGTIKNTPNKTVLYLVDWETNSLFDSIQIIKEKLDYEFHLTRPKKFYLHNKRNKYPFRDWKFIWLEPSKIKINGNFEFLKNLKISGSASQAEFENYSLFVNNASDQIDDLRNSIYNTTNEIQKKDLIKIELLRKELSDSIVNYLLGYPNSYVTLFSLHDQCYLSKRILNKEQISNVYDNLSKYLRDSFQGVEIRKYIELPVPPKVGDIAPEIIQTNVSGDTVRLSDYRGNYLLVDFWASACAPCRGDNKWLRKIYFRYNPEGFEILGVSGDYNRNHWIDAIKHDSLPWTNISDLKGWKNEAFLLYDVKSIPQNLLIDPNGLIIHRNFRSESYADMIIGNLYKDKNGL